MGTERFIAWIATRNTEDTFRLSMALFGVFVVVVWESMRLWSGKWQRCGRLVFVVLGGIGYASVLAVALYTLVRAFAGYR